MLNAEKFKDKIMYSCDGEFGFTDGIVKCAYDKCDNCIFSNRNNQNKHESCSSRRVRWLLSEYKEPIKLTRLEYLLLKLFYEKDYRYLTRGVGGYLYMHKGKNPPQKNGGMWFNCEPYITFDVINDLFQFVQWKDEEPKSIKKILNNCEVSDGESE